MNKIILDNKTFYYQVFFKKNKNMYLRIKNGIISISAPNRYSLKEIEVFIIKHKNFVLNHIDLSRKDIYDNDSFMLWGKEYKLIFSDIKTIKIIEDSVYVPNKNSKKKIEKFYKKETISYARNLIDNYLKFTIKDIDLDDVILFSQLMKSRFGSCNIKTKRININSILARFNSKYLKAVLIHEIVHLKESNHQRGFYDMLLEYEPEYRIIHKELNKLVKMYKI
ncbi:MAG: SprT-like domain-containing protein [Candidatus Izemoplasmatales bacterium]